MPRGKNRRSSRHRASSVASSLRRRPRTRSGGGRTLFAQRDSLARDRLDPADVGTGARDRIADALWPACAAAFLLGTTIALIVCGLAGGLRIALSKNPDTASFAPAQSMVVGASLLTLAIGVRVPQRMAIWFCVMAWRRFVRGGRSSGVSPLLVSPGAPDRKLYWAVFSVIALATGVSSALLPLWVSLLGKTCAFLHVQFVWSQGPLFILNFVVSMLAGFVPLAFLGLSMSTAHHLCCRFGQWDARATAWSMIGAAPGVWLVAAFGESQAEIDAALVGAALPALLVAIGATALGSIKEDAGAVQTASEPPPLPACSDRWPTLLRASVVGVGGGLVCAIAVWTHSLTLLRFDMSESLVPLLVAGGAGVAAGCRTNSRAMRTIGAFGMCAAAAGIVVGVGTYAFSIRSFASYRTGIVIACGAAAVTGYATSFGRTVLLARVAQRSSAGARMLAHLLICSAMTVLLTAPLAMHFLLDPATLMLVSMLLIALGGLLIIYEPSYTPRVRRARLSTVFGSVAAMILLGSMSAVSRVSDPPAALPVGVEIAIPRMATDRTHDVASIDR